MFRTKVGSGSSVATTQNHTLMFKGHRRPVSGRIAFLTTKTATTASTVKLYALWKFDGATVVETSELTTISSNTTTANTLTIAVVPAKTTDGFQHPVGPDGIRFVVAIGAGTLSYDIQGAFVMC